MAPEYIQLTPGQLAIAASLILVSGLVSILLRLGLERQLAMAAARTVVQLILIGQVLKWVFAPGQAWYVVLAIMAAMTLIAGGAAVSRVNRRYRGIWLDSVVSMWASSWLIAAVALLAILQVPQKTHQPWYQPQYAIPLLGMILGNTLNGISLGMDCLGEQLASKRDSVETLLALGATRWEAARASIQQAVRTGMIPMINTMMIVGVVSLPGMMTGQLLSGASPVQAVRYQIVIMFLLAAAASLATVSVVLLGYRRLFTPEHRFLADRLKKR